MVAFAKGQRKDDLAQQYLTGFTGDEGVLFVGRAQEKNRVFSHREATQLGNRDVLPVDRDLDRGGEPVLLLAPDDQRRPLT